MRYCILISLLISFFILSCGCSQISPQQSKLTQGIYQDGQPIDVSGPMKIYKPGYYQLSKDLTPTKLNQSKSGSCACFFIGSSDVVFDGMGHIIDGSKIDPPCPQWSEGFYFSDKGGAQSQYPFVTIKNMTIINWNTGIELTGVQHFQLENVTVSGSKIGVSIHSSSNVSLNHNIFLRNSWEAVWGRDNEYVTIDNNTVSNNPQAGIYLDGYQDTPPEITLLGSRIVFYQLTYYKKATSGSGYVVSSNEITDNKNGITIRNSESNIIENNNINSNTGTGITLFNIDNSAVRDNIIKNNHKIGIHTIGRDSNLAFVNNTFSGNSVDTVTDYNIGQLSFSVILGTILVYLFKVLTMATNIVRKLEEGRIYKWIKVRTQSNETAVRSTIHGSRIIILSESPVFISIVGAIIFGGAFAFTRSIITIPVFCNLIIISGIVTVTPRAIQYFTAQKNGIPLKYRMWWGGIVIILITMFIPRIVFGQPVRTDLENEEKFDKRKIAVTKLAGPITCILLSGGFFLLYLMKGSYAIIGLEGLQMSLLSALVMLLPISPMEGERVCKWNKSVWAVFFFSVLLGYGYLLIAF